MNTEELAICDSNIKYINSVDRVRILGRFSTSLDVIDEKLQFDAQQTYDGVGTIIQALNYLDWSEEDLIDKLDMDPEVKSILEKYIYDFKYFGGLGAANNRKKKNAYAVVNSDTNLSNIKDCVKIFSALVVACSSVLAPTITHLQNERMNRIEEMRIQQRNRELDQRDRELDIIDNQNLNQENP